MTELTMVRGLPFPCEIFHQENLESAMDFVPHDGDFVVASFPKTGTTWLQYIVLQIASRGEIYPAFNDLNKVSPFLESTGAAPLETLEKPRVYKHHFPYNMMQKNPNAKYMYIYRNPEDAFVSFYHFMHNFRKDTIDFDQFFEDYLSGNVAYGRYFEHILTYLAHKEDENVLLVSYEKLHRNREEEILRVAKFLGEEYHQSLLEGDLMEKIVERTSFDYMKKNLHLTKPDIKMRGTESNAPPFPVKFFRKGTVGDGKQTLNSDQIRRLQQVAEEVMKGTDIVNDWYKD